MEPNPVPAFKGGFFPELCTSSLCTFLELILRLVAESIEYWQSTSTQLSRKDLTALEELRLHYNELRSLLSQSVTNQTNKNGDCILYIMTRLVAQMAMLVTAA